MMVVREWTVVRLAVSGSLRCENGDGKKGRGGCMSIGKDGLYPRPGKYPSDIKPLLAVRL